MRFGETSPMVPMLAEPWPSRSQIWRVKAATEVLPLVPVTAAIVAGCRGKNRAAASANARRGFGVTTKGTRASPCGAWSPAIATAPAAIAASIKREPSVLLPASAKNRSPGLTARLSTARPFTSTASACGPIAASSLKRSRSFIFFQSGPAQLGAPDDYALLGCPRCRKNKAVGRRQIETRLDAQQRSDAGNHLAAGRHRVPARGDEALGFRQRLRLIQHDQELILRIVGRNDRG